MADKEDKAVVKALEPDEHGSSGAAVSVLKIVFLRVTQVNKNTS